MRTRKQKPKNTVVRVRRGTRDKLDQIASLRRWKIGETIDAIADHFIESNQSSFQKLPDRVPA
jgi:hypothetical protein